MDVGLGEETGRPATALLCFPAESLHSLHSFCLLQRLVLWQSWWKRCVKDQPSALPDVLPLYPCPCQHGYGTQRPQLPVASSPDHQSGHFKRSRRTLLLTFNTPHWGLWAYSWHQEEDRGAHMPAQSPQLTSPDPWWVHWQELSAWQPHAAKKESLNTHRSRIAFHIY